MNRRLTTAAMMITPSTPVELICIGISIHEPKGKPLLAAQTRSALSHLKIQNKAQL